MRTIIEVPTEQLNALDDLCRRDGISRAEAIRRAIASHLAGNSSSNRTAAHGLWRDRGLDGLMYEQTIRREWDR